VIKLAIHPELAGSLPPLEAERRAGLEAWLREEGGCRDALVVWRGEVTRCAQCDQPLEFVTEEEESRWVQEEHHEYREHTVEMRDTVGLWCDQCGEQWERPWILLDGHHRYAICQAHDLFFRLVEAPAWVETFDDAKLFILRNQDTRRNLSEDQASLVRGQRYELEKRREGRPEKLGHHAPVSGSTADRLGAEYGVDPRIITRDAQFAKAVDLITQHKDPHFREAIMRGHRPTKETPNGERELTRVEIIEVADFVARYPELRADHRDLGEILYDGRALMRADDAERGEQRVELEEANQSVARMREQTRAWRAAHPAPETPRLTPLEPDDRVSTDEERLARWRAAYPEFVHPAISLEDFRTIAQALDAKAPEERQALRERWAKRDQNALAELLGEPPIPEPAPAQVAGRQAAQRWDKFFYELSVLASSVKENWPALMRTWPPHVKRVALAETRRWHATLGQWITAIEEDLTDAENGDDPSH
jgi:hypothetical protein